MIGYSAHLDCGLRVVDSLLMMETRSLLVDHYFACSRNVHTAAHYVACMTCEEEIYYIRFRSAVLIENLIEIEHADHRGFD
jgi:hypothetical protein